MNEDFWVFWLLMMISALLGLTNLLTDSQIKNQSTIFFMGSTFVFFIVTMTIAINRKNNNVLDAHGG